MTSVRQFFKTKFYLAAAFALLATLGLGKAYAVEWITEGSVEGGDLTAIKIIDWSYLSSLWDVEFVFDTAANVYGEPLAFPFKTKTDANEAIEQISRTLNSGPSASDPDDSAVRVGTSLGESTNRFNLGYAPVVSVDSGLIDVLRYDSTYQSSDELAGLFWDPEEPPRIGPPRQSESITARGSRAAEGGRR